VLLSQPVGKSLLAAHSDGRIELDQPHDDLLEGQSTSGKTPVQVGRQVEMRLLDGTDAGGVPMNTPQVGTTRRCQLVIVGAR
jgi:hypothetical protein